MSRPTGRRGPLVVCCEDLEHSRPYVAALVATGVAEEWIRLVTPQAPGDDPAGLAARAAGLLLCGGPDLDPGRYGEERTPGAELFVDEPLDELEWRVLEGARAGRTPTWALCRGLQTANVFLGGTLYQDIYLQIPGVGDHRAGQSRDALVHGVSVVAPQHPAARHLAGGSLEVNSRHHQAIKDPAPGLEVVARAEDGVIEVAALDSDEWWLRGVQWHPENLVDRPTDNALWREFAAVAAAGAHGAQTP